MLGVIQSKILKCSERLACWVNSGQFDHTGASGLCPLGDPRQEVSTTCRCQLTKQVVWIVLNWPQGWTGRSLSGVGLLFASAHISTWPAGQIGRKVYGDYLTTPFYELQLCCCSKQASTCRRILFVIGLFLDQMKTVRVTPGCLLQQIRERFCSDERVAVSWGCCLLPVAEGCIWKGSPVNQTRD